MPQECDVPPADDDEDDDDDDDNDDDDDEFDDVLDVTDDGNLTAQWEQAAYQDPLAKRIIGNTLM